MPWTSAHMKWIKDTGKTVRTDEGYVIKVYEFFTDSDDSTMRAWAKHFRNHYCFDSEIDILRDGTGYSRKQYLEEIKFPSKSKAPGPSIRSGDFGEILVADYVEFILQYWVPRTRYADKTIRNESTKGSDIIGFQYNRKKETQNDKLLVFEAKAKLTYEEQCNRMQDAVNDSVKDNLRKAESLNAIKQRLYYRGQFEEVEVIKRFQNQTDRPYTEISGAAAILVNDSFDESILKKTIVKNHPNADNIILLLIKGEKMMDLVHELYRRAANEA